MSGNVWEWCLNEFKNPANIALHGDASRALRGGAFGYNQNFARCAYSFERDPYYCFAEFGFRVVCASENYPSGQIMRRIRQPNEAELDGNMNIIVILLLMALEIGKGLLIGFLILGGLQLFQGQVQINTGDIENALKNTVRFHTDNLLYLGVQIVAFGLALFMTGIITIMVVGMAHSGLHDHHDGLANGGWLTLTLIAILALGHLFIVWWAVFNPFVLLIYSGLIFLFIVYGVMTAD